MPRYNMNVVRAVILRSTSGTANKQSRTSQTRGGGVFGVQRRVRKLAS